MRLIQLLKGPCKEFGKGVLEGILSIIIGAFILGLIAIPIIGLYQLLPKFGPLIFLFPGFILLCWAIGEAILERARQ